MKKRVVLIITLILIVTIVLITFIAHKEKNQFKMLTIKNISSIKIIPAMSGPIMVGKKEEEFPLDLNGKAQREMANNILSWLKSGRMMGNANNEAVSNGGTPTYLLIELKNGTSIYIKSAFSRSSIDTSTGIVTNSQNTDGQVTISTTNSQEVIRELSPKLKIFLDNGWKSFFNYNSK